MARQLGRAQNALSQNPELEMPPSPQRVSTPWTARDLCNSLPRREGDTNQFESHPQTSQGWQQEHQHWVEPSGTSWRGSSKLMVEPVVMRYGYRNISAGQVWTQMQGKPSTPS